MRKPAGPSVDDMGCQANFDEGECSDQDDMYEAWPGAKPNMVDCSIQTSNIHFTKITNSDSFKAKQEDKAFSTDWSLSSLYDELSWKKVSKNAQTQDV